MPVMIDGNNLLHAWANVEGSIGRGELCALLGRLGDRVSVVFDGPPPPDGVRNQIELTSVEAFFAAPKSADDIILQWIAEDTAPRRLTLVSSDRELRRAARRRRCRVYTSQQFVALLRRVLDEPADPPSEPTEKRNGLAPEQTRKWLQEFGFDRD